MQSVLAFLTLAEFFLFFLRQLCFPECGRNEFSHKIEVDFNFLCGITTALAVTLMHKDFVDKLIQHGNGQIVKALVFLNECDKLFSGFPVLLKVSQSLFQRSDFLGQLCLLSGILCVQSGISGIRQLAEDIVLINLAEQDFQL